MKIIKKIIMYNNNKICVYKHNRNISINITLKIIGVPFVIFFYLFGLRFMSELKCYFCFTDF